MDIILPLKMRFFKMPLRLHMLCDVPRPLAERINISTPIYVRNLTVAFSCRPTMTVLRRGSLDVLIQVETSLLPLFYRPGEDDGEGA